MRGQLLSPVGQARERTKGTVISDLNTISANSESSSPYNRCMVRGFLFFNVWFIYFVFLQIKPFIHIRTIEKHLKLPTKLRTISIGKIYRFL